jgi:hypothetical protein
MIQLLEHQRYIDIIFNVHIGWVLGYVPHLSFVPHCFYTILYVLVYCCFMFCVCVRAFYCLSSFI